MLKIREPGSLEDFLHGSRSLVRALRNGRGFTVFRGCRQPSSRYCCSLWAFKAVADDGR